MSKYLCAQLSFAASIITVILALYGLFLIQIDLVNKLDVLKTISPSAIAALYFNRRSK